MIVPLNPDPYGSSTDSRAERIAEIADPAVLEGAVATDGKIDPRLGRDIS